MRPARVLRTGLLGALVLSVLKAYRRREHARQLESEVWTQAGATPDLR